MAGRMEGWIHCWMKGLERWVDGLESWMGGWINEWIEWLDCCLDGWSHRGEEGWMDDWWMNGWTAMQTPSGVCSGLT